MRWIPLLALVILYLFSCNADQKKNNLKPIIKVTTTPIDNSKNILISSKSFHGIIMDKSVEAKPTGFTPTIHEIIQVEEILKRCMYVDKIQPNPKEIKGNKIREPDRYIRQYFGSYNQKKQKTIRINCFWYRTPHNLDTEEWKFKELYLRGLGNNFFQILINLEEKDCSNFQVRW